MHRYKVDAVVSVIVDTREQLKRLKEILPTIEEIAVDVSDDEKKLILQELELLEIALNSLVK